MNIISNRFFYLNGRININLFNLSFDSYKIKCTKTFYEMRFVVKIGNGLISSMNKK